MKLKIIILIFTLIVISNLINIVNAQILGETNIGTSIINCSGTIKGSHFIASENGIVYNMSFYATTNNTAKVRGAIYLLNTQVSNWQLIASTEEKIFPTNNIGNWNLLNFTNPYPQIQKDKTYALVIWTNGNTWNRYFAIGELVNQGKTQTLAYTGIFPSPPSFTLNAYKYSIYVNYIPINNQINTSNNECINCKTIHIINPNKNDILIYKNDGSLYKEIRFNKTIGINELANLENSVDVELDESYNYTIVFLPTFGNILGNPNTSFNLLENWIFLIFMFAIILGIVLIIFKR
jgi:hypothetical protein